MLSLLRTRVCFSIRHKFKVDSFSSQDYKAMSSLIKERYVLHNDEIKVFKDIKLLDESNKLIGVYPASQARKKAANLNKDITLVNSNSDPVICRVVEFRNNILNKFFDEIVYKHNEKLLNRADSTKELKASLNLNQNELKLKARQIIELSKKNLKVRVFMNCKEDTRDQCLEKLQFLKSEVQGRCLIQKDVRNYRQESEEDDTINKRQTQTYSFTCKSRDNEFLNTLKQSSEKAPEVAVVNFLKKYHKQEDVDMQDLAQSGRKIADRMSDPDEEDQSLTKKEKKGLQSKKSSKIQQLFAEPKPMQDTVFQREAKARILNERLKVVLGWTS